MNGFLGHLSRIAWRVEQCWRAMRYQRGPARKLTPAELAELDAWIADLRKHREA